MEFDPVFKKNNIFPVGRAATGIYLIFKDRFPNGSEVIVPANLCYAAIYPILYAGLRPRFCDVDPVTGNVTMDTFRSVYCVSVVAAILPHMYGNPIREMKEIAGFCKENRILLIEDCASAMGASSPDYELGDTGDYVIYSTGYSKTLDLGYGGFVCSDLPLTELEREEKKLSACTPRAEEEMTLFSKLYRLLRNEDRGTVIGKEIYRGLPLWCRDSFLYRLEESQRTELFKGLNQLADVIDARKKALQDYVSLLDSCSNILYPYEDGAVPWRFNILLPPNERKCLIRNCLERKLPVSDWYPAVTPMFGVTENYPGTEEHAAHIVNFPLLISPEVKREICEETIRIKTM